MANQGLKNYTRNEEVSIGRITMYTNINKSDSNVILNIPLMTYNNYENEKRLASNETNLIFLLTSNNLLIILRKRRV